MRLLPDAPPTDPDVRISLIRFLGAGGLSPPKTKQARPRLAHNYATPQAF